MHGNFLKHQEPLTQWHCVASCKASVELLNLKKKVHFSKNGVTFVNTTNNESNSCGRIFVGGSCTVG
jgi:hypothetical protein